MAHYIYGTCPTFRIHDITVYQYSLFGCKYLVGRPILEGVTKNLTLKKMGWYPAMCSLCYWWLNCSLNDLNDCIIFIILTLLFCSNLILDKLDKSVSPPLTSSKKIINRGYMGNWTKYMWTNPKYCNTEAKNTLDARCISIQCWYDRSNIFWKNWFPTYFVCTTPSGVE